MGTEHNLNQYLNHNQIIQTAYNYTDPDLIATIIMQEFNNIIDIIAPRTKRQIKKNYTPYLNKDTREAKKKLNEIHNKTKRTQHDDDWREYKNQRATINKKVDKQKQEYITKKLNNSENRWKTLNEINNKTTFESPRSIIHKDAITTNIQEICNIAMKMLKRTTTIMAPLITHLIKQIIIERKFPK